MKCQFLFSGKNKKNSLKLRLLTILPQVLSFNSILSEEVCLFYDDISLYFLSHEDNMTAHTHHYHSLG